MLNLSPNVFANLHRLHELVPPGMVYEPSDEVYGKITAGDH